MKTLRGRTLAHLLLILSIVILTVAGCGASEAPTIPPEETFVISFEDFENGDTYGLVFVTESQMQATSLSFPLTEQFPEGSALASNHSN
jgi:hypothetical protein